MLIRFLIIDSTIFNCVESLMHVYYFKQKLTRAIRRILEGVHSKNLEATLLFVDFSKSFDSIHRGTMEQILLAYGLPKETVAAIMMRYKNTKVKVRSPDGNKDFLDIVAGVLQEDTLAPDLFIICLDCVLWRSIDLTKKWFYFGKKQKIHRRNDCGHGLRWWHSASGEYTHQVRFPAA